MNTPSPLTYQPQASAPSSNVILSMWNAFWNNTANFLLRSSEPQISVKSDRLGVTSFYIFDPVTNRTHCVGSETEAIAWMEQNRY